MEKLPQITCLTPGRTQTSSNQLSAPTEGTGGYLAQKSRETAINEPTDNNALTDSSWEGRGHAKSSKFIL